MKYILLVASLLFACKPTGREMRALVGEVGECSCPCADAAPAVLEVDAAPDAPPDVAPDAPPDARPPIDMSAPWTRTIVTAGSPTGAYRGADGTALDTEGCWSTGWEEGGIVTRACPSGAGWTTELVASGLPGVEEARAADLDGDGVLDVVSCSDSGGRCYVTFRGAPNVTTTLTASIGHGHAMQAAIADFDGDGRLDVVFGTRAGTASNPAVIAWLGNPGAASRTGSAWTYHLIDVAGWTMSLVALDVDGDGDIDIVTSDRSYTFGAGGAHLWGRNGARWLEHTAAGAWVSHAISPPSGACPTGQPMCTTKTPGDEMFLRVDGNDVWDCQSSDAAAYSRIVRHSTTDWIAWAHTVLPAAANVGHCQGMVISDVDGDGLKDVVVSSWKGNTSALAPEVLAESAVYGLLAPNWNRFEISGPSGIKFDGIDTIGPPGGVQLDLITSEQVEQLGVVAYVNPWRTP